MVDEVDDFIYSLAREYLVRFDIPKGLIIKNKRGRKTYSRNHLHLNDPEYEALNQKLKRILTQLKK